MVSPYDYWQFWRNTEDGDVARFLKLFTTLPLDEIDRLAALEGEEINEAKKVLATEATALVHGRAAAEAGGRDRAARPSRKARWPKPCRPSRFRARELASGIGVLAAFAEKTGLVASNSEARRQIKGGGLKVNDKPSPTKR